MLTFNIYQDNDLKKTFTDQESDQNAFGYMLRIQGNSINHALRYEGWNVEVIDQDTGEKTYWKPYA